jgi:monothiol glutaredoxin
MGKDITMGEQDALATIKSDVENNKVFLYMKGTPDSPQCGFSAQVVQVLKNYGINFGSRNVLEDWDIREGIKKFANWPTIPQLYVKGKFVGGSDIVSEMHRKGQLAEVLKDL